MKRLICVAALCLWSTGTHAGSSSINSGSSMTSGPSSNHYSLHAGTSNPALGELMIGDDKHWRFSYFPSVSVNVEIGEVDNFSDDLDELIDILDDPNSSDESVSDLLDRFNQTLVVMGESGYIKNSASVYAPLFPLYYSSDALKGTFTFELKWDAQVGLRILDAPLSFDNQNSSFSTATALYLKSGIATSLSAAYSREIPQVKWDFLGDGKLYGGVKLNLIRLELSKQVTPIQQLDGKDVDDVIKDEYDSNLRSSTNVAIDVGVVWDSERYRAGFTIANLNSPSFDYGTVGENCDAREENSLTRSACETARFFALERGEISTRETHTMQAFPRIDGLYKISKRWLVSSSLDLAEYNDVVGFDNQWFHVATSYEGRGYLVPSTRIGYQTNLADGSTSSINAGVTLFKALSLDLEWGLESVTVDGSSVPRRLGFALGFEQKF